MKTAPSFWFLASSSKTRCHPEGDVFCRRKIYASCLPGQRSTTNDERPTTSYLLHNLADRACAHCMPAFADGEAQTFFHRHWRDQLDHQADVIARHHHLGGFRKFCHAGHVRGSQIKLRTVPFEEWRV